MTNNLYREINHKADLSYEIVAENVDELLSDVVKILLENSTENHFENENKLLMECLKNFTKKCYNIDVTNVNTNSEFLDSLFDIVNEIISLIDSGFYPLKIEQGCVHFCKRRINLAIKALTYHNLSMKYHEGKLYIRMVFDV